MLGENFFREAKTFGWKTSSTKAGEQKVEMKEKLCVKTKTKVSLVPQGERAAQEERLS